MIHEIPREKLSNYLSMFDRIKYLRNILVGIPIIKTGCGYTDNLEKPGIVTIAESPDSWLWFLSINHQSPGVSNILERIAENNAILVPSQDEKEWLQVFMNQWKFTAK